MVLDSDFGAQEGSFASVRTEATGASGNRPQNPAHLSRYVVVMLGDLGFMWLVLFRVTQIHCLLTLVTNLYVWVN